MLYHLEHGNRMIRESYEKSRMGCSEVLGVEVPETEALN